MNIQCPSCDAANHTDAEFCSLCGRQLTSTDPDALWERAQAHRKLRGQGGSLSWKRVAVGVAAGFGVLCILFYMGFLPEPAGSQGKPASEDAQRALTHGNGYDWQALSVEEKLEVGLLCAKRTGRHTRWTYADFIDAFYDKAQSSTPDLLKRRISELAAVAAAMDIEE